MVLRRFLIASAVTLAAAATASAQQELVVAANKAEILRLPADATAVVLGNPAIADTTLFDTRTLFLTGKTYGRTNLIALDASGEVMFQADVRVVQENDGLLYVFRNVERESYTCLETCDPTAVVGDSAEPFDRVSGQAQAVQTAAQGGGGGQGAIPAGGN